MELTIEVPERVVRRAAELGLPVETLVSRAMDEIGEEPLPPGFRLLRGEEPPAMTVEEATARIREIQRFARYKAEVRWVGSRSRI